MKRQVRRGVFETNSSSTHSLTMCLQSDYDRWTSGEVLLFRGSGWCYPEGNKPQKNGFYTKEEAIAFEKVSNIHLLKPLIGMMKMPLWKCYTIMIGLIPNIIGRTIVVNTKPLKMI